MAKKKLIKKARILIVDDHPAVRDSLASWIGKQDDMEVCGEAADMIEALSLVSETHPDLAVVDISLQTGNGIEFIKRIMDRTSKVRVLVWSSHNETLYAERSLRAGALGYIQKDQAMNRLLEGIRRVLEGKFFLSDWMTDRMLHRAIGEQSREKIRKPIEKLADRELEVFRLIGEGIKTAEIALRLHLSVHTIETYRERIKAKLGLKTGSEMARYAMQWVLENN